MTVSGYLEYESEQIQEYFCGTSSSSSSSSSSYYSSSSQNQTSTDFYDLESDKSLRTLDLERLKSAFDKGKIALAQEMIRRKPELLTQYVEEAYQLKPVITSDTDQSEFQSLIKPYILNLKEIRNNNIDEMTLKKIDLLLGRFCLLTHKPRDKRIHSLNYDQFIQKYDNLTDDDKIIKPFDHFILYEYHLAEIKDFKKPQSLKDLKLQYDILRRLHSVATSDADPEDQFVQAARSHLKMRLEVGEVSFIYEPNKPDQEIITAYNTRIKNLKETINKEEVRVKADEKYQYRLEMYQKKCEEAYEILDQLKQQKIEIYEKIDSTINETLKFFHEKEIKLNPLNLKLEAMSVDQLRVHYISEIEEGFIRINNSINELKADPKTYQMGLDKIRIEMNKLGEVFNQALSNKKLSQGNSKFLRRGNRYNNFLLKLHVQFKSISSFVTILVKEDLFSAKDFPDLPPAPVPFTAQQTEPLQSGSSVSFSLGTKNIYAEAQQRQAPTPSNKSSSEAPTMGLK